MRSLLFISTAAVAALALSACGPKVSSTPQATGHAPAGLGAAGGLGANATTGPSVAPNVAAAGQETPEQLRARAAAAEAEANRLAAEASGQSPPPTADNGGGSMGGNHSLGESGEKLHSGQYYETVTFQAEAGQTYELIYDTQGYVPAVIVLDASNQVFSRSVAGPRSSGHIDDEIKPDASGTWHVLLTSSEAGATGQFKVALMKVTERPIN